ncbi:Type II secretory pathway, component ExeA (predicted ATPase) [Halomicrobium zhouii]|uniref:Type II secretory pathway, component ExeA (Predicted ATPase) n=1 Tax=Halomicrobium zhouii TaxID=767519 RepID=A0A1I6M6L6_9EURY|nr:ATP-binding protein [Halomicrobium zhouii]SFS11311.1 Type II secretory pathway, component ExeA (predicted ATPase) [Halomicrobium zhouii]
MGRQRGGHSSDSGRRRPDDGVRTGDGESPGRAADDTAAESRRTHEQSSQRSHGTDGGVILDQLDQVEDRLLAFGRALGGDPADLGDLPFTEEAGLDGMPEPLYVRHDRGLLNQVTSWLLQDQHIGLVSPYGTGKTAFREILRRDLGEREDFVVAYIENPAETTPRGLYERILRTAFDAGYEIDTSDYWQVNDGIPWATDETKQAVEEVTDAIRADGKTILLVVDELEDLPESLLPAIQVAGDAGVRLFLSGTPTGKERLSDVRATLDSRVRFYDGIEPFGPAEVAEYVERSLAYFRDEPYEGQSQELFTQAAIEDVYERTGGNPREVRLECRELFTRAGFVWFRSGQDIDRIKVTPELRHRQFAMG